MKRAPLRRRKPLRKAPKRPARMAFWAIANWLSMNSTDQDIEEALDDPRGCPFDSVDEVRDFLRERGW